MEGGTPQQEDLLSMLLGETLRAGHLVAALLQMARLDQGEIPSAEPCDVVELCRQELSRMQARAPRLRCLLDVAEPAPGPLMLSPEATGEALANLLDNASRHASGQVRLGVTTRRGQLRIAVEDDGPGLPADVLVAAFERFVSLDGQGGSGMGLPIARALARVQGGDLVYDGQAFVLTLPMRPAYAGSVAEAPGATPSP